jgi:hypothetical protein
MGILVSVLLPSVFLPPVILPMRSSCLASTFVRVPYGSIRLQGTGDIYDP